MAFQCPRCGRDLERCWWRGRRLTDLARVRNRMRLPLLFDYRCRRHGVIAPAEFSRADRRRLQLGCYVVLTTVFLVSALLVWLLAAAFL